MAERVFMMDCGDGIRRADNGCAGTFAVKTAAYTITGPDTGKIFTNRGAGGSVTFTLPAPKAGMRFTFIKAVESQNIVVTTNVAGTKLHGAAGATQGVTLTNSTATEFGSLTLWCDGTAWYTVASLGTWAVS